LSGLLHLHSLSLYGLYELYGKPDPLCAGQQHISVLSSRSGQSPNQYDVLHLYKEDRLYDLYDKPSRLCAGQQHISTLSSKFGSKSGRNPCQRDLYEHSRNRKFRRQQQYQKHRSATALPEKQHHFIRATLHQHILVWPDGVGLREQSLLPLLYRKTVQWLKYGSIKVAVMHYLINQP
jgi:hypothetical protein